MLISHKHKFLFVHIAKTGGTSIRVALRRYRWGGAYTFPAWLGSMIDQASGHRLPFKFPRHAKAIAAKEMLPDDFYRELFKFTVVRNPFDIQVSSYYHLQKEHPASVTGIEDFGQFIRRVFDPGRDPDWALDITSQLMCEYVTDIDGSLIVDFIAKYENLQQDFNTVCDRIGLPQRKLPHELKAESRKPYREYYDAETRAIVERHYAKDLEIFGYTF